VIRKIGLALVLMTVAGVAAAKDGSGNSFWNDWGHPDHKDHKWAPVTAPEIDPASAMAGLSLLAGGLVVLRGRRKVNSKE
jgi:LPXTG-motif cell wall-anchored protein